MARFYGEVSGTARTTASRMGNDRSGLWAHIRGWHVGACVQMRADGDEDVCNIDVTHGSSYGGYIPLGSVATGADGVLIFTPTRVLRDAILKAEGKRASDVTPSSVNLGK